MNVSSDVTIGTAAIASERIIAVQKPTIVGLYGISGSGKTHLLGRLSRLLDEKFFAFYEGSEVIASSIEGGLSAFHALEEEQKIWQRAHAIERIKKECVQSGKTAIVTGHFMLWAEEQKAGHPVHTRNDMDTYTHIVYIDISADQIRQNRAVDTERHRPDMSVEDLDKWQQDEKVQLRDQCYDNGILFLLLRSEPTDLYLQRLFEDFRLHDDDYNTFLAESRLDEFLTDSGRPDTALLIDADRTLAAEDTGTLFWESFIPQPSQVDLPLKKLFKRTGYSYYAFRQSVLLHEEAANDQRFDKLCGEVAKGVHMHPEFICLLRLAVQHYHVIPIIVTCGLRCVWEKVLKNEGLSDGVKVIGGGRLSDRFVVTPAVKSSLVIRLQRVYNIYVWAFGDSPVDLEMLKNANKAIVVVGEEHTRSKSMDAALTDAIENHGFQARQTVLPCNASPRLDDMRLPLIRLTDDTVISSIFSPHGSHATYTIFQSTHSNAAKLLMTPMRNAANSGPDLRTAHRNAGRYLTQEYLASVVGLEQYTIQHVQGHETYGYRFLNEKQTLIVALMRAGEPMAAGVNDILPLAMFVHAREPEDIREADLQNCVTVILVDSVVNSGKTALRFLQYIRALHATVKVVLLAGVVQNQFLSAGLIERLKVYERLNIIALRVSANKFTGSGATDTGNRLFNTTHLC